MLACPRSPTTLNSGLAHAHRLGVMHGDLLGRFPKPGKPLSQPCGHPIPREAARQRRVSGALAAFRPVKPLWWFYPAGSGSRSASVPHRVDYCSRYHWVNFELGPAGRRWALRAAGKFTWLGNPRRWKARRIRLKQFWLPTALQNMM